MGRSLHAQGATEYLVLLAVVLVIALVGIALLGFFPGTASEAQARESELYWKSASPVAITEWDARVWVGAPELTYPYFRLRNNGPYPIRLAGLIAQDGGKITTFYTNAQGSGCSPSAGGVWNIRDYYYMAPGEEKYFAWTGVGGAPCDYQVIIVTGSLGGYVLGGATSACRNSASSPGYVEMRNFGFEYVQYIEGQEITKRQMGAKPVIIRCLPPT